MYWSARPFVRIFIFLAAGIYLAFNIDALREVSIFVWYGIVASLLMVGIGLLPKRLSYTMHRIKGIVLGMAIVLSGILLTELFLPEVSSQNEVLRGVFTGVIESQPSETDKVFKALVKLNYRYDSAVNDLSGRKAMIYFEKDSTNPLHYGDVIIFSATLKPPDKPGNPGEFNYKSFLKAKGIGLVGFVSAKNYWITGSKPSNWLVFYAIGLRNRILNALKENGLSGEQYAVAAAIVLGYDDTMDDRIRENYQRAGAMHVLCVSGLHVGVIYLVLSLLLRFLNNNRKQKIVKVIVLLLSVWAYALLTGLAPSVLRATIMVSFFIIGKEVERDKDAYNTLAMSAVFLLVINPGYLFDVGFQLSYAAVLGIVTFYRPVFRLIYCKNMILRKVWGATAISIAAQLGAFPVALHYFHYFPTWFLLSNLVIMLFSTFIISLGMLFIVLSWVPVISGWIAYILSGSIYLMNYLIKWIGRIPFSGVSNLYFPWYIVVVVVLVLSAGFQLIVRREKRFIIPLLSSVLLLVVLQTVHRYNSLSQSKIVIYQTSKNHLAIDFANGNQHKLLCDSLLIKEPEKIDFFANEDRISRGLKPDFIAINQDFMNNEIGLWSNEGVFSFNDISIVMIDGNDFYPLNEPFEVDWIWITGKGKIDLERLKRTFKFKKIIVGQSVYRKFYMQIVDAFSKDDVFVYNSADHGAFVYDLATAGTR